MHYSAFVVIEKDEDGFYAHCPALEGCYTQGDTYEETVEHAREAVELYLEVLTPEERRNVLTKQVLHTVIDVEI